MCTKCGKQPSRHPFTLCLACLMPLAIHAREAERLYRLTPYPFSTLLDRAEAIVEAQRVIRAHAERPQP